MNFDQSVKAHLYEILEEVSKAKGRDEAVKVLQKYDCLALRDVLKGAFDPSVKWLVNHKTKYVANKEETTPSSLLRMTDRFKYLVYFYSGPNTQYNSLSVKKREDIWQGLLEAVHPKDAEILLDVVQKKIDYKNVSAGSAIAAFPGLWKTEE